MEIIIYIIWGIIGLGILGAIVNAVSGGQQQGGHAGGSYDRRDSMAEKFRKTQQESQNALDRHQKEVKRFNDQVRDSQRTFRESQQRAAHNFKHFQHKSRKF